MKGMRGFTLLELMATIAIVGIVVAVGLPSLTRYSHAAVRSKGATELYSALATARSEAIARNAPVTVCRRDYYATGAFPRCAASTGAWAQGWIVYQDDAGVSGAGPAQAGDVIAVFDPVGEVTPSGDGDTFRIVPSMTFPAYLVFQANGRVAEAARFTFCDRTRQLTDGRRIEIALSGRVALAELSRSDTSATCS